MTWQIDEGAREPVIIPVLKLIDNEQGRRNKDAWRVKLKYSAKPTKFCKISTLLLSYEVPVKSQVKISQNFVVFSEYMNFTTDLSMVACSSLP